MNIGTKENRLRVAKPAFSGDPRGNRKDVSDDVVAAPDSSVNRHPDALRDVARSSQRYRRGSDQAPSQRTRNGLTPTCLLSVRLLLAAVSDARQAARAARGGRHV